MSIKKKLGMAIATTALGAMLIGGGTLALFTAEATNSGNTFSTGSVIISLDKPDGTHYFDINDMAPGDHGSLPVVVSNDGTLELKYTINSVLTGDLSENDPGHDGATPGDDNPLFVKIYSDPSATLEINPADYRTLAAGANETIFVKWELPAAAGNGYQGKSALYSISVNAEQTKNNP